MKLTPTRFNGVYYRESKSKLFNKKPDKCFYIKYYKNKRQIQEAIGWLSLGYNAQIAHKIRIERLEDTSLKVVKLSFNEAFFKFFEWSKLNKKSWKTDLARYKLHIEPHFGKMLLTDITSDKINTFILGFKIKRKKDGAYYAPQTVKHIYNLIRRVFNFVKKLGFFTGDNPVTLVELEKFDNSRVAHLTRDELFRLINVCDSREIMSANDGALIKFAIYTGLRKSELFALKWDSVDIEHKIITLYDTKGKKNQSLLISDMAVEALSEIPNSDVYVFPSVRGGKRNNITKLWRRAKQAANIRSEIVFHDIRHTFGTMAVTAGVPVDVLQKMMTHKDIRTTQRYAHIVDQRLRDGAKLLDQAFFSLN